MACQCFPVLKGDVDIEDEPAEVGAVGPNWG